MYVFRERLFIHNNNNRCGVEPHWWTKRGKGVQLLGEMGY